MMGIVPVQVRGRVSTNDALYASPYHPGFAVSGQHLQPCMVNKSSFIGYAFTANNSKNSNDNYKNSNINNNYNNDDDDDNNNSSNNNHNSNDDAGYQVII